MMVPIAHAAPLAMIIWKRPHFKRALTHVFEQPYWAQDPATTMSTIKAKSTAEDSHPMATGSVKARCLIEFFWYYTLVSNITNKPLSTSKARGGNNCTNTLV